MAVSLLTRLATSPFAHAVQQRVGPASAKAMQAVGADRPQPAAATPRRAGSVIVVVLVDFAPGSLLWGWSRLVLGRQGLGTVTGLRWAKVLGSGDQGGFGLKPSRSRQGLFLGFDDEAAAQRFITESPALAAYRAHARECCVALLRAATSRGSWGGAAFDVSACLPAHGLLASLTRASIRPRHAAAFWRHAPPSEHALAAAPGCLLAVGLGEAPVLRQATFSVWTGTDALDAYARSGAHLAAIRAAYGGGYFSESMFVRFVPLRLHGCWQGQVYDEATPAMASPDAPSPAGVGA